MRLLVSGYRGYTDEAYIRAEIKEILQLYSVDAKEDHTIIHGGCPTGVDHVTDQIAKKEGWKIMVFPAQWKKHGKAAGPIRNEQMVTEGNPDMALLFLSSQSKGTKNMLSIIEKMQIPHVLITLND